jgi:hypothetical protein
MYKHIQEIAKIYEHLNYLRSNTEGGASLNIGGFAPTPEELPTEGIPVNTVYLTNGDSYNLWVWNGEQWNQLNLNTLPLATTATAGLVQLGTLAGVNSDVPSPNKAITEEVLANYRQSGDAGVPSGTIIMWWGVNTNIPPGWVYCDGTSGTPDLRDRFPKCTRTVNDDGGDTGGLSTVSLTEANMPGHNHAVDISGTANVQVGHHSHTFSGSVVGSGGSHTHYVNIATDHTGSHTHGANTGTTGAHFLCGDSGTYIADVQPMSGGSGYSMRTPMKTATGSSTEGSHGHIASGYTDSGGAASGGTVSGSTNSTGGFNVNSSVRINGTTGNKGNFTAFDNKPPFMELIFIMKL